jgi:hypothetical protein
VRAQRKFPQTASNSSKPVQLVTALQPATVDRSPCSWIDVPVRWLAAVGPQIARAARPAAFSFIDGALIVIVRGAIVFDELTAMRVELLEKLPASIDGTALRRLVLKRDFNDSGR